VILAFPSTFRHQHVGTFCLSPNPLPRQSLPNSVKIYLDRYDTCVVTCCVIVSRHIHRPASLRHCPTLPLLFSPFAQRVFDNSFALKRLRAFSKDSRRWGYSSHFGTHGSPLITRHCIQVLSFHILANSFAVNKITTLLFSSDSKLFAQNTGGVRVHPSNQKSISYRHVFRPFLYLLYLPYFLFLGQRAKMEVVRPPRGVNSPRTTHHSGLTAATMSRRILLTAFS
jgi:hypothetical protein